MVVTDRRVCFTTLDAEPLDGGSLDYGEIAAIDVEQVDTDCLVVSAMDGTGWRFPLPDTDLAATAAIETHLRWIGTLRGELLGVRNDVELAAGRIRDHADAMEWEAARAVYHRARGDLDALITEVQLTTPIEDHILAPELTDIERTLEEAAVRLAIERAHSELELATDHVEAQEFERAKEVLCRVQGYYERARDRREAVQRADAFLFGTQRELEDDLESLGWELETVAAEPVGIANETKVRAQEADEPRDALEHWETALEQYEAILTLDRAAGEPHFVDDPERIREEQKLAAEQIIDLASELARTQWNDGADRQQAGETKLALECCQRAYDHLERAHELALVVDPNRALDFAPRLKTMAETIAKLTQAVEASEPESSTPDGDETAQTSPADETGETSSPEEEITDGERDERDESAEHSPVETPDESEETVENSASSESSSSRTREGLPSVSDLLEMDTHHEITLELGDLDVRPAEEKQTDSESTTGTSAAGESTNDTAAPGESTNETATADEPTADDEGERTDGGVPDSKSIEVGTNESVSRPPSNGTD